MNKTPFAVITGNTSGLGAAIEYQLIHAGWSVFGIADHEPTTTPTHYAPQITGHHVCDIRWRDEIAHAVHSIGLLTDRVDVLINCAGINFLSPFTELDGTDWERLMDVNAKAPWMLTQELLPYLERTTQFEGGTVLNIVSNAARVPMTHSLVYNASKAAALMVTRQMARELFKTHGLTVFSISPNKLAGTAMSRYIEEKVPGLRGWSPEEAAAYQRAALPIGEETSPDTLAEFITFLLSTKERHRYLHGCDIPYGG